jgi:enoyl-CoA hydratase/carnithine racemase
VLDVPWSRVNIGRSAIISVISVEQRGPVTIRAINRPEKLNAINKQVAVDLQSALPTSTTRTNGSRSRTGALGRAFSAGTELMLLGEPIPARRGYEVGLANRVVPDGTQLGEAIAMSPRWRSGDEALRD